MFLSGFSGMSVGEAEGSVGTVGILLGLYKLLYRRSSRNGWGKCRDDRVCSGPEVGPLYTVR